MDLEEENNIKATLLYHLRRKRVIGAKHTPFDGLKHGFQSHLGKDVEKIAHELIKRGFLILKPTSYGPQVSLNKDRIKEIEEFIFKIMGFRF